MNLRIRLFIFAVLTAVFISVSGKCFPPGKRPDPDKHCFDYAGVLDAETIRRIENEARGIHKNLDIDLVVLILPSLQGRDIRPSTPAISRTREEPSS